MLTCATKTAGMDLGDKYSHICVIDEAGEITEVTRVQTNDKRLAAYFALRPKMTVVMETGTHSPWVSRLVEAKGHEVIVANARRLRLISENHKKTDETDAELLARLGRADPKLLAPIKHRKEKTQVEMVEIRARAALVEARTQLVNSVRGLVKAMGYRMPGCSSQAFGKKTQVLPSELRPSLEPMLACIEKLSEEIKAADKRIEAIAETTYPTETKSLRSIPGVGALTALAFILTLEDPSRFKSARTAGAFLGLTRRRSQSGDDDPQLRITKRGNPYLRKLLVQSAHYILGPHGPDSALRRWGQKLAERGGKNTKKRARVAVARKLAVLMYRLWVTSEIYEPFRAQAQPS